MSRVITFSRSYPAYHPKKGEPTHFVEALINSFISLGYPIEEIDELCFGPAGLELDETITHHKRTTIRAGHRFKAGDFFSPRVWSGKPYCSKQIVISSDIEIKKVWQFELLYSDGITNPEDEGWHIYIDNLPVRTKERKIRLAENDGLTLDDMLAWFRVHPKTKFKDFSGQIICWDESVEY